MLSSLRDDFQEEQQMPEATPPAEYNYDIFVGDDDFLLFQTGPKVGSTAPDPRIFDLESGSWLPLSSFWKSGDLVIEFGSFS